METQQYVDGEWIPLQGEAPFGPSPFTEEWQLAKKLFYEEPIYYFGNAMTIVPTGTPIAFPSYSQGLDFELELAFVLNATLLDASAHEAFDAIGGFVLLNDFSARDVQRDEMGSGLGACIAG